MTAIVPDTLQGALIISVIDFFLSFLIISGIGVILAFFPLLNRAALFFKPAPQAGHGKHAAHAGKAVHDHGADAQVEEDIAAVMAAVLVVMDGSAHRILSIQPSASKAAWSAQGRAAQHESHTVR